MHKRKSAILMGLALLLVLSASRGINAASFTQWAIDAKASSQYGSNSWSALQMTGAPNTYPQHGDKDTAWAPSYANSGMEWVELTYPEAVVVERVDIYETYNPGAITKVELIDASGTSHLVWQGKAAALTPAQARVFQVQNHTTRIPSNKVRITLETDKVSGWNEIDAVGLLGKKVASGSGVSKGFVVADGDTLAELEAILLRLKSAIERARTSRAADPNFLADLDQILDIFYSISDDLQKELESSGSQWGAY